MQEHYQKLIFVGLFVGHPSQVLPLNFSSVSSFFYLGNLGLLGVMDSVT